MYFFLAYDYSLIHLNAEWKWSFFKWCTLDRIIFWHQLSSPCFWWPEWNGKVNSTMNGWKLIFSFSQIFSTLAYLILRMIWTWFTGSYIQIQTRTICLQQLHVSYRYFMIWFRPVLREAVIDLDCRSQINGKSYFKYELVKV